ncbi:response regulator [uncultured Dokdonia sp.]|jgi:signal transduction histidine kinase/ActR/RegA family two-component response regulator/predicted negative regulator of RcsB-dependent stress response|uniref:response regulator n=1 Tax=uncultured Dokdonia sp. TaxID=575653 RepID=UPI0030ED90EE|tara:strand:+ start:28580 stop:30802 length:2223 start_codon:yes stop_codon:yes gene_type:complete
MNLLLVRFLLALLLSYPVISIAQERENVEETLTNDKIDSLLKRAVIAVSDRNYNHAIDILKYSRDLATGIGHTKRVGLASGTLAKLYFQLNDYEKALIENERAIALQKETKSLDLLGQSYITATQLALIKKDTTTALTYISNGIVTLENSTRDDLKAQLHTLKGDILRNSESHLDAIASYNKSIEYAKNEKSDYLKTQALTNKALSLAELGRLEEADETLLEVESLLSSNNFPSISTTLFKVKHLVAQGRGNYREANDHLTSYYQATDQNTLSKISSVPLPTSESQELDDMVKRLEQDIEIEEDRNSRAMRLTLVLSIALCSILALLTLSLYKNNNLRAKANELLQAKNVELVIARDNAEKASMVKAQFLSTITHELRTPMYAVTGLTHLLLSENPTEDQKKHLDSLKFSGEYLLSLINNILDLNKLEANKVEVEETAFNIKKRIEDVLFALGKSARDKGNKLHIEFDPNIPTELLGDPLMISQVLINLVGNAIKFTRDGDVWVRVQKIKQGESDIKLHFEIEDNGEGISKKKQKTIFQNFTQGSVAINRKFGGTGLGLSIVKNLLDLLNSEIILESTLGKGTTFKFDLNYNLTQTAPGEANANDIVYEIDYNALENRHILVVEDNKINQMITRKILEKNKITCETADNGEIAVEKARTEKFDLILMDIHMPGISGIEATEQIRLFDKDIPILALTAVTIDENIDEFHAVGFNDIIPKPYKVEEFFQKIYNGLKNSKVLN